MEMESLSAISGMRIQTQGELIEAVAAVVRHVTQHIAVEERYLLPAAQAMLTHDDWKDIEFALCDAPVPPIGHESSDELGLMFARLAVLLYNKQGA
jgi:hemerythrin-like domain-containing protein